ncbi:MAG: S8 family serine peptidase [Paramuribaculum sp.]|nr:S8 family serine peptidase [Paramuribaculum sp.]
MKITPIAGIAFALALAGCSDAINEPEAPQNLPDSRSVEIADTTYKYAYYYDDRVEVPIDESKKYVIVEETVADIAVAAPAKAPTRYAGYIVDAAELLKSGNTSIMAASGNNSPIVAIEDVTAHGTPLNNFIYVGLKNESDLPVLERLAKKIGCIVHGSILDHPKWIKLETGINSAMTSLPAAAYLYENGDFQFVDPGFEIQYESLASTTPSDPYFSQQWNLTGEYGINILPAWAISKGSPDITLAIYDTGVVNISDEFTGRFTQFYYDNNLTISNPHGTQVAAVAAASHNMSYIAGVAPNARLMNLNWTYGGYTRSAEEIAEGFILSYKNGADIINCSWGASAPIQNQILVEEACKEAIILGRNGKGCIVVFAAGNSDTYGIQYPARNIHDAITVGSTNTSGIRKGTSYGPQMTVSAPGHEIPTTPNEKGECINSGTSYAAPQVSGLAALILSIRPELTAAQVKQLIIETASRSTHSDEYGWGIINAGYAMQAANQDYAISCPSAGVISPNDGKLTFTLSNVPRGATVSWSSKLASQKLNSSNSSATFFYPSIGAGYETVSATVSYLGKTKEVTYQCYLTLSTVVNSINILEDYDWLGANQIHLFADCSKENAPIEWKITSSNGCNFQLVEFPLAGDASFMSNPNAYITLQYGDPMTPLTSIPEGAYCEITAEVNEPYGVWHRCTLRWTNLWNGYQWILEDNGFLR